MSIKLSRTTSRYENTISLKLRFRKYLFLSGKVKGSPRNKDLF